MLALDDKRLITRTQHGDSEAFNPLVEKYHPRLLRSIHRRVRDPEVAKDLCQETWLKAFRGIGRFRGDAAFFSWVSRIAENVIIDYFRKPKHDTEPLHRIAETRIAQTAPCPSVAVERAELRVQLRTAIAQLTRPRRVVFVLYYLQGLSIKAIASRLNRSEGTVKTHLRTARLQLRVFLQSADI